ncbi:DoxX family protein [Halostella sp. JP-L12]|uniref:DoxX family protein n=1 Tax=Halostella TaxID=1843185 RepID=UPI000EF779F3|nr:MULTISPECIES: DoxX family protein [Halostella]NHN48474.1 DoxX family protein [Halostella sp. JP-L12]
MTDGDTVRRWLPLLFRAVVLAVVGPAALEKAIDYGGQVAFFESLGVPAPTAMVAVVGATEAVTTALVAVGTLGRVAGLVLAVVMVSAAAFGGPNAANLAALVAALGVAALGTGAYSLGPSTAELLGRGD